MKVTRKQFEDGERILYNIEVEDPHVFFASKARVLTHNEIFTLMAATGVTLTWAFSGTAITFTGLELGLGALFLYVLHTMFQRKDEPRRQPDLLHIPALMLPSQREQYEQGPREPKNNGNGNVIAGAAAAAGMASKAKDSVEPLVESAENLLEITANAFQNATQNFRPIKGFFEQNIKHILREGEGHLTDTLEHRKLLTEMASSYENLKGFDKHGNEWLARTLDSGKQLWASVREGIIRNAGINNTPNEFNPETGLSRLLPPRK